MTIKYLRNLLSSGGGTGADAVQVLRENYVGAVQVSSGNMRFYPPTQMTISQIYASVGTASSSNIDIDVKVDGNSILGGIPISILANENVSDRRSIPLIVPTTSYITFDVNQAGGSDLSIYVVYSASTTLPSPPTPSVVAENTIVFLMSGEGQNNSDNNTFIDESSNNFTITQNGIVAQGTYSPFSLSDGKWSTYFTGNEYLYTPANSAYSFGTSDFTIELWVNISNAASSAVPFCQGDVVDSSANDKWWFGYTASSLFFAAHNAPSRYVGAAWQPSINTWYHVAVCRSAGQVSLFIDGILQTITMSDGTFNGHSFSNNGIAIGAVSTPVYYNGYVSNLHIVNGTALYSSNFTVPSSISPVSNTVMLTCASKNFKDTSTYQAQFQRYGNPSISSFSPFNVSALAQIPPSSTVPGSAYADGDINNYLSVPASSNLYFETGDFTIETWIKPVSAGGGADNWGPLYTIDQGSGSVPKLLFVIDQNLRPVLHLNGLSGMGGGGLTYSASSTLIANAWSHLALVRSGSTLKFFINGIESGSYSNSTNISFSSLPATVLGCPTENIGNLTAYISDFRVVKGSAVYTGNFTPPSDSLSAISGTQLLLKFKNGSVIDLVSKNDLRTVGNTKISTVDSKWGNGSVYFDGSGDYALSPPNDALIFNTGDFTIECWINPSDVSTSQKGFFQLSTSVNGLQESYSNGIALYFGARLNGGGNALGNVTLQNGGLVAVVDNKVVASALSSAVISSGIWSHVALSRSNGVLYLFVNGVLLASTTSTENITASCLCVGGYYNTSYLFTGYIQDLRISNGIGRYTSAFSPPSSFSA